MNKVYRICLLVNTNGNYQLQYQGETFSSAELAKKWIKDKGDSGVEYVVLQVIEKD